MTISLYCEVSKKSFEKNELKISKIKEIIVDDASTILAVVVVTLYLYCSSSFSKNSLNIASYNPKMANGVANPTITLYISETPNDEVSGSNLVITGNKNKDKTLFRTVINP